MRNNLALPLVVGTGAAGVFRFGVRMDSRGCLRGWVRGSFQEGNMKTVASGTVETHPFGKVVKYSKLPLSGIAVFFGH